MAKIPQNFFSMGELSDFTNESVCFIHNQWWLEIFRFSLFQKESIIHQNLRLIWKKKTPQQTQCSTVKVSEGLQLESTTRTTQTILSKEGISTTSITKLKKQNTLSFSKSNLIVRDRFWLPLAQISIKNKDWSNPFKTNELDWGYFGITCSRTVCTFNVARKCGRNWTNFFFLTES